MFYDASKFDPDPANILDTAIQDTQNVRGNELLGGGLRFPRYFLHVV